MEEYTVTLTEYEMKLMRLACDHASDYYETKDMVKLMEYESLRERFKTKKD